MKKIQIAVIGKGSPISDSTKNLTIDLGKSLVDNDYRIICGGLGGVMEAVCEGAHHSSNYSEGSTIGILPSTDKSSSNKFVDISIATGFNYARNQVIIASADIVVGVSGGAGTLSEIAFAWQYGKPIILFEKTGGWSEKLAGKSLDKRKRSPIYTASSVTEILQIIRDILFEQEIS